VIGSVARVASMSQPEPPPDHPAPGAAPEPATDPHLRPVDPGGAPPSWSGAPAYSPYPEGYPPHAPMPGAPPYPAQPPVPRARPGGRTSYLRALGATAISAAMFLLLGVLIGGPPESAEAAGRLVGGQLLPTLLASLFVWLLVRRHARPFWQVAAVALGVFLATRFVVLVLAFAAVAGSV
jgi:hypothetical protein